MAKYLISLFLLVPLTSFAQTVTTVKFPIDCLNENDASLVLDKFGEVALLEALSSRTVNDKDFKHPLIIFMNPKTKSYTMLERIGNDESNFKYCIIAVGPTIKPSTMQKNPSLDLK